MFIPVATTATLLFDPASGAQHAVFSNEGTGIVYLGQQGVTAALGFPLHPGQQAVMPVADEQVYGITGPGLPGSVTGSLSSGTAAGATALPVASGGTSFTAGMLVQVGSGVSAEVVTVGAGATGTSVPVSALQFSHDSGDAITEVAGHTGGTVSVTVG